MSVVALIEFYFKLIICITIPEEPVNLISNIGFGENASHTKLPNAELANLNTSSLEFPLKINPFVAVDRKYDEKMFDKLMKPQNLFRRSLQKLNCLLNP